MNDEEVSDEQMVKCFGKNKNCGRICRLKEVCLGKYKEEEAERRHRIYRDTCYIDEMDASSGHVAADAIIESKTEYREDEVDVAIDHLDVSEGCRKDLRRIFRNRTEGENTKEYVRELLRRLGEMYVNDPTGFELLFFQLLAGGNQVALAKKRGCTKQNINKIIVRGKSRLEAYRKMVEEKPECRLSGRELAVFHAVELDGMTNREAADILGCSRETIRRVCQMLRSKGVKCAKKRPGRRKKEKNRKNSIKRLNAVR